MFKTFLFSHKDTYIYIYLTGESGQGLRWWVVTSLYSLIFTLHPWPQALSFLFSNAFSLIPLLYLPFTLQLTCSDVELEGRGQKKEEGKITWRREQQKEKNMKHKTANDGLLRKFRKQKGKGKSWPIWSCVEISEYILTGTCIHLLLSICPKITNTLLL